jgi:alpha-tubulin suppressor-like RCC1 family protein
VLDVVTGLYHLCARLDTGAAECWGYNIFGEIGDGTSNSIRFAPTSVAW